MRMAIRVYLIMNAVNVRMARNCVKPTVIRLVGKNPVLAVPGIRQPAKMMYPAAPRQPAVNVKTVKRKSV